MPQGSIPAASPSGKPRFAPHTGTPAASPAAHLASSTKGPAEGASSGLGHRPGCTEQQGSRSSGFHVCRAQPKRMEQKLCCISFGTSPSLFQSVHLSLFLAHLSHIVENPTEVRKPTLCSAKLALTLENSNWVCRK